MTNTTARIHEHAGNIRLRIGEGETQTLPRDLAEMLAQHLNVAVAAVRAGDEYKPTELRVKYE